MQSVKAAETFQNLSVEGFGYRKYYNYAWGHSWGLFGTAKVWYAYFGKKSNIAILT